MRSAAFISSLLAVFTTSSNNYTLVLIAATAILNQSCKHKMNSCNRDTFAGNRHVRNVWDRAKLFMSWSHCLFSWRAEQFTNLESWCSTGYHSDMIIILISCDLVLFLISTKWNNPDTRLSHVMTVSCRQLQPLWVCNTDICLEIAVKSFTHSVCLQVFGRQKVWWISRWFPTFKIFSNKLNLISSSYNWWL